MRFEFMQNRSLEIDRLVMMGLLAEILCNLTNFITYRLFTIAISILSAIILLLFITSVLYRFLKE